jgi:uncharacterized protein
MSDNSARQTRTSLRLPAPYLAVLIVKFKENHMDHAAARVEHRNFNALDWISLVLMIIGGLNWGLVGAFDIDLVATLFGSGSAISRVVYILVGLAALWGLAIFRHGSAGR